MSEVAGEPAGGWSPATASPMSTAPTSPAAAARDKGGGRAGGQATTPEETEETALATIDLLDDVWFGSPRRGLGGRRRDSSTSSGGSGGGGSAGPPASPMQTTAPPSPAGAPPLAQGEQEAGRPQGVGADALAVVPQVIYAPPDEDMQRAAAWIRSHPDLERRIQSAVDASDGLRSWERFLAGACFSGLDMDNPECTLEHLIFGKAPPTRTCDESHVILTPAGTAVLYCITNQNSMLSSRMVATRKVNADPEAEFASLRIGPPVPAPARAQGGGGRVVTEEYFGMAVADFGSRQRNHKVLLSHKADKLTPYNLAKTIHKSPFQPSPSRPSPFASRP